MIRPRLRLVSVALFIFLLCIIIVLDSPGRRNQFDAHPSPLPHASAKVTVTPPEKLAYATYLASTIEIPPPDDRDRFFVATRMLVYQILHDPKTRTQKSIPILILVDPGVSQSKRDRLEKDGAIVIPVDYVRPDTDWLKPHKPRWRDMMVKLRLWELEEYSRILFIDSDTVMNRPFDDIFDEEGAQLRFTVPNTNGAPDEAVTATKYAMAGVLEVPRNHSYPPERNQYLSLSIFNGGFFVCAPSRILFHHYISVLNIPNRFDSDLMEMALLNYAHRDEGPMPWARLPNTWNVRNPNKGDVVGGVASVHEKWWKADEFKLDSMLGDLFLRFDGKCKAFMWVEREPGLKKAYGETSLCQKQTEGTFNTTPYGHEAPGGRKLFSWQLTLETMRHFRLSYIELISTTTLCDVSLETLSTGWGPGIPHIHLNELPTLWTPSKVWSSLARALQLILERG